VFGCGSEGLAEHLLVRGHLASAWAEAPKLAWASTGADWPRPPSVPPAIFMSNTSNLIVELRPGAGGGRGWGRRSVPDLLVWDVPARCSAAPGLAAVGLNFLSPGQPGGQGGRWGGRARAGTGAEDAQ